MVNIAIAGSGGLAQHIAHFLKETPHNLVIISRAEKPQLVDRQYDVFVVDYDSPRDLRMALQGVDLVISTIDGVSQRNLIEAAVTEGVQRFVPAEFGGVPSQRPPLSDIYHGRHEALLRLQEIASSRAARRRRPMQYTVFVCGIFYERFARGGLLSKGISVGRGFEHGGAFLLDIEHCTGEFASVNSEGRDVKLCMTSVVEVAYCVVAALELDFREWPPELRMRGDRKSVKQIVQIAETVRGERFSTTDYSMSGLNREIEWAHDFTDPARMQRVQFMVAAVKKHYDYPNADLGDRIGYSLQKFNEWMQREWAT